MFPPMWIQLACMNIDGEGAREPGQVVDGRGGRHARPLDRARVVAVVQTSFSTPVCHSQSQTITFAAISATVTAGNVLVGTLSFSGSIAARRLRDHEREQGLLRVQAVLGLVPDRRARPVEDVLGDLLAVVGGEAVQDDRVGVGEADERRRRCRNPARSRSRRSRSSSWPMLVQTSV